MSPRRLRDLTIDRVAIVDRGADQDAEIVMWKRFEGDDTTSDGESAEVAIEKMAKSIWESVPFGDLTREQAYAAALETPEGRELYSAYKARRPGYTDD